MLNQINSPISSPKHTLTHTHTRTSIPSSSKSIPQIHTHHAHASAHVTLSVIVSISRCALDLTQTHCNRIYGRACTETYGSFCDQKNQLRPISSSSSLLLNRSAGHMQTTDLF